MRVHQCPRCELRFRDEPELKAHLGVDHGVDLEVLERQVRERRRVTRVHRQPPDPTRVLSRDRPYA